MRIGIADFTPQRPGGNASPAGNRYDGSHCRNRESAGTMRRDRYPNRAGTPLAPGTAGEIDHARGQRIEQKEFPEDGGQCRRAGFDPGRSGRGCRNRSFASWPGQHKPEAERIRPLPARRSWNWRILCRERTQHPFSRAAIRCPSSQFHSPWRTGHCNRAT